MKKKKMKKKRINLVVESCKDCPYSEYDGNYNISRDSGYDCGHYKAPYDCRIVDDSQIKKSSWNSNPEGWPEIPAWCPLKNA